MSTRSAIIAKTENGYSGIYCHFDGYTAGVGRRLLAHYKDAEKVKQLIALGDISSLGIEVTPKGKHSYGEPEKDVTIAYIRDRGESSCEAKHGKTVDEVAGLIDHNGYVYVFDGDGWTCNGKPLAQAIADEGNE